MKIGFILLLLVICVEVRAQTISPKSSHKWLDSFELRKAGIHPLDASQIQKCESTLRNILKSIDENSYCAEAADCVLLNQDPFGATVPVRNEFAKTLLPQMKVFSEKCDSNSFVSSQDIAKMSVPGCFENRCVVLTGGR